MDKKYQVLARKYRPQRFSDVVGQEAIVATLKNAVKNSRVAHAYLFCGSRGTGKTTLARLFAKALNCTSLSDGCEPCNICPSCKDITSGHSIDVLEIDGASHRGIEDIRQINEAVGFAPTSGKYKIYLIDEVHMLTKEAFNALLKTLEEPPEKTKFFFATTEPHKIPQTILSRCQRFHLGRISAEKIQNKLVAIAEDLHIQVAEDALTILAELAEGSLRDAQSLFDQVIAFQEQEISSQTVLDVLGLPSREIFFSLDEAGVKKEYKAAFEIASGVFSSGRNISYFLEELISHFRALLLVKSGMDATSHKTYYQKNAEVYREDQLLHILEILHEAQNTIKFASSERVFLEMLLLRILSTHQRVSLENLVDRLTSLEKRLGSSGEEKSKMPVDTSPAPVFTHTQPSKAPAAPVKPATSKEFAKQAGELSSEVKSQGSFESAKSAGNVPEPEEPKIPVTKHTLHEKNRFDTLMRFAAKELNGSLKLEKL